jgi:hypothetical protein
MPKKATLKELREAIKKQKQHEFDLMLAYGDALYFESMPEYNPLYKYCYSTSNRQIPHQYQSVDSWLRAINKHRKLRRVGHGGGKSSALIISIPTFSSKEAEKFGWIIR